MGDGVALDWLEAEAAIRQLVACYSFAVDDRDFDALARLFDPQARLVLLGGWTGEGRGAIMALYRRVMRRLGPSGHYMHDILVTPLADGTVRGVISAHAEFWAGGATRLVSLRYHDRYRATDEGWRIGERSLEARGERSIRA